MYFIYYCVNTLNKEKEKDNYKRKKYKAKYIEYYTNTKEM